MRKMDPVRSRASSASTWWRVDHEEHLDSDRLGVYSSLSSESMPESDVTKEDSYEPSLDSLDSLDSSSSESV